MLGYIISDKDEINVKNSEIKSFDILHKTNLNIFVIQNNKILYKNDIIQNASRYNHIDVLEWFKNSGYDFKNYSGYSSIYFKVISRYPFIQNYNAIVEACNHNHIQILEWFKNSGYEFKYDERSINNASHLGHLQVLEWFKNSGYKLKYYKYSYETKFIKILKFYSYHLNIKKLIKWSKLNIFIKTIKFKTNNKYLKGYQKN
jgi:hypothetical protein